MARAGVWWVDRGGAGEGQVRFAVVLQVGHGGNVEGVGGASQDFGVVLDI